MVCSDICRLLFNISRLHLLLSLHWGTNALCVPRAKRVWTVDGTFMTFGYVPNMCICCSEEIVSIPSFFNEIICTLFCLNRCTSNFILDTLSFLVHLQRFVFCFLLVSWFSFSLASEHVSVKTRKINFNFQTEFILDSCAGGKPSTARKLTVRST